MWTINARNVWQLRSPGGDRFTEFVDALIRTQSYICGLPYSEIHTNLRTNIPDGGVDTEVCKPVSSDPTGWLKDFPTIWQYKATQARDISHTQLERDVNKQYATDCIKKGFAYRLCICDNISNPKRKEWKQHLNDCVRKINPAASEVKVLTADDLAAWTNRFPSLVLRYFRSETAQGCLHIEAWGRNIISVTRNFVSVPTRETVSDNIKRHVLSPEVPELVFSISGEAGVGKTRLVYESLVSCKGAGDLVVYTDDEQKALELAASLANDLFVRAILVADECGAVARVRLNELLKGSRDRIRVVTIDNTAERSLSGTPESWLERIPNEIVEKILASNYQNVPEQRRTIYANLAGGFVRFAADLCNNDGLISSAGRLGPALGSIRDYLNARLSNEELRALQALSLVIRLGVKGDVAYQLDDLCGWIAIDARSFEEIANRLHDRPGFAGRTSRFFYVTPELVAQVAFELAWIRWARDPEEFLKRIPQSLLETFLERVARSASDSVRRIVSEFFLRVANNVKPAELTSVSMTDFLVTLVEVDPSTYLPTLRRIVEEGTDGELRAVSGNMVGNRWGPRRSIVWLAERIAALAEHFDDAERILLKLALAESEPNIGNNATAIWKQLFRLYLSGTALAFLDRLRRLENRIFSGVDAVSCLALDALDEIFERHVMRSAGPYIMAGKILPEEWRPKTGEEYKECWDAAVALLQKVANQAHSGMQQKAREIAIRRMRNLLALGYLRSVKDIFPDFILRDEMRARLTQAVEEFLRYDIKPKSGRRASEDYAREVKSWLDALKPRDLHGRVNILVGVDPSFHSVLGDEQKWKSDLRSLAVEFLENRDEFEREVKWLCSANAKSTSLLGHELGKLDKNATFLDLIFESTTMFRFAGLARGYVLGLLTNFPDKANAVNERIDQFQDELPEVAFEVFMVGGDSTKALQRTLQLTDNSKLPITCLGAFSFGVGPRFLTQEEYKQVLIRLMTTAESGDPAAIRIAVQFLAFRLDEESKNKRRSVLEHPDIEPLAWRLVEIGGKDNGSQELYWWAQLLRALTTRNADRAARVAAAGLVGESLQKELCEEILISLADKDPKMVMESIGEVVLDKKLGEHFYVGTYRSLIQSLPAEIVIKWIKEHGVEAARRLARHLPTPYVDWSGNPAVPPLTEFVLKTFEDDDRTFSEFCVGVHGFQFYSGDIAAQHEKEAETARRFLDHRLRRVREWANLELESSLHLAERWRQTEEELNIEGS